MRGHFAELRESRYTLGDIIPDYSIYSANLRPLCSFGETTLFGASCRNIQFCESLGVCTGPCAVSTPSCLKNYQKSEGMWRASVWPRLVSGYRILCYSNNLEMPFNPSESVIQVLKCSLSLCFRLSLTSQISVSRCAVFRLWPYFSECDVLQKHTTCGRRKMKGS